MTINNGDILRVTAKMVHTENDIMNVYHARYDGAGEDDWVVASAIETRLDDAYGYLAACMGAGVSFYRIDVWNVTQDRAVSSAGWPTLTDGDLVEDTMPLQASPMVLFGTSVARSQGRKYLPPPAESMHTDAGTISGTLQAALLAYALEMLDSITTPDGSVLWGNWNPVLQRFAVWITLAVKTVLRTQRRRVTGVGS